MHCICLQKKGSQGPFQLLSQTFLLYVQCHKIADLIQTCKLTILQCNNGDAKPDQKFTDAFIQESIYSSQSLKTGQAPFLRNNH